MFKLFEKLKSILLGLFKRPKTTSIYVYKIVNEVSTNKMRPGCVYIERRGDKDRWAHFVCPDGCGAPISLNLMTSRNPHWTVEYSYKSGVTINPSVWKDTGCRSHFFIRNSEVEWAG